MGKGSGIHKLFIRSNAAVFTEGEIHLSITDPIGMSLRLTAAMDYVANSRDEDVRPHYLVVARQMLADIQFSDLTTAELVSLVSVLMPARSRKLAGTQRAEERVVLRLLARDDAG